MTPPKADAGAMEIHEKTCPRLCHDPNVSHYHVGHSGRRLVDDQTPTPCTCTCTGSSMVAVAEVDFDGLVEAAILVVDDENVNYGLNSVQLLGEAVKTFRGKR